MLALLRGSACAAAVVAAIAAAPALGAQNTTPPDALHQPLVDGCQRSAVGLLTNTSAHWVYVYGDASPREAEGTARDPHPGGGDLPQAHDWYDQNFDLRVSAATKYLTGLPPSDEVHVERESGKVPRYAWATDGDSIKLWGSWIWDCGHWGPQDPTNPDFLLPGTGEPEGIDEDSDLGGGESTEIHPYQAIVITRANPYVPSVGETEADVYLTTDGTRAHAEEQCASDFKPPPGLPTYGPDFSACVSDPTPQDPSAPGSYAARYHQPLNVRDYSFFVPAPPKPAPGAHLRWRVEQREGHGAAPKEQVEERANGIQVTIPYRGFGKPSDRQAYSKAFFVGWDGNVQQLPAHIEVTLHKLKVINSLDAFLMGGTSSQVPPGEYGMYLDLNGHWDFLNDFAPGLGAVQDNTTFDLGTTFGVNVQAGRRVRLKMATRECDLPKINPCPTTPEAAEDNDDPGDVEVEFPSVDAALGDHVLQGGGKPGAPNWTLSYSVRLVSRATTGSPSAAPPPGGLVSPPPQQSAYPDSPPAPGSAPAGCFDTFSPIARFQGRRVAARRRLVLRGRASDRTCGGKRGRVLAVGVAVARRVGRLRCRFVRPGGRLGPLVRCRKRSYLAAHGTARWRLVRRVHLARGLYTAWTRSVDAAGNVGYARATADRARFRVR